MAYPIPRTAVSIFGFILLSGLLIAMVYGTVDDFGGNMKNVNSVTSQASNTIKNSTAVLQKNPGVYDYISAVFSILFGVLTVLVSTFALLFVSTALFIVSVSGIPFIISGIFIALISLGTIFALLSKIISLYDGE
jgi:hypothetical protein